MAYSPQFMSHDRDVKDVIDKNRVSYETNIERLMFDKRQLEAAGYSKEEIESLMPEDLEERFSFMENRSITDGFNLQNKPTEHRDGSGKMLIWKTEGAVYRLRHNPPGGAPISLTGFYNVQRIVYKMLVQKYPEIQKAYDDELLEETNFIPLGFEEKYLEFEQQVMNDLEEKTREFFMDLLIRKIGFNSVDVYQADVKVSISQIEVCWNQPVPFDSFGYLHEKTAFFVKNGFTETQLHAKTPLFVSKFMSEVIPNQIALAYKNYKKTKKILRNEIILGNTLKGSGLQNNETLSDTFFRNTEDAKKYAYSKMIFEWLRRTEGLNEEKYKHGYRRFKEMKEGDQTWKKNLLKGLVRDSGIPDEFKDLDFFDIFAEQLHRRGFVKRKFFSHLSDRKYRRLIFDAPESFERCGRGKYRPTAGSPMFNAVEGYRVAKDKLMTADGEKSR